MVAPQLADELFLEDVATHGVGTGSTTTLSVRRAPLVRLGLVANHYRRLTSRQFRARFGIGATDWRMLVILTVTPGSSVADAAAATGLDKAAVSRSLAGLRDRGLAVDTPTAGDRRRQDWHLTPEGCAVHDRALQASLRLNRAALAGLDEDAVAHLTALLDRVLANVEAIGSGDGAGSDGDPG